MSGILKQGTKVVCNGYKGVIVRHYDSDTYEIRLPGGLVATSEFFVVGSHELSLPEPRYYGGYEPEGFPPFE